MTINHYIRVWIQCSCYCFFCCFPSEEGKAWAYLASDKIILIDSLSSLLACAWSLRRSTSVGALFFTGSKCFMSALCSSLLCWRITCLELGKWWKKAGPWLLVLIVDVGVVVKGIFRLLIIILERFQRVK